MQILSLLVVLSACRGEPEDTSVEDTTPVDGDGDGVAAGDDCDDEDGSVFPGAVETCDGVDQDCDGAIDDEATDRMTTYADGDGDGFGAGASVLACELIAGYVPEGTDCDDAAAAVNPAATETCNGVDDDCANGVDDGLDLPLWYADADKDGFGAGAGVSACEAPADHVADAGDCNDGDADVKPGVEGCGVPLAAASCADALSGGEATTDGVYTLPNGTVVWCDMTTDGGGWTAVARVIDEPYDPAPPAIGSGAAGTWSEWTAHAWRSGDSYYLPLDVFAALTDGTSEVMQLSRAGDGTVIGKLVYADFDYDAVANTSVIGACTDLVGTPCAAGYSWKNYPPGFNGWGRNDYCNQAYPNQIWNYHPETGCASASGLFAYTATTTPRPANLGVYTATAYENLILVR